MDPRVGRRATKILGHCRRSQVPAAERSDTKFCDRGSAIAFGMLFLPLFLNDSSKGSVSLFLLSFLLAYLFLDMQIETKLGHVRKGRRDTKKKEVNVVEPKAQTRKKSSRPNLPAFAGPGVPKPERKKSQWLDLSPPELGSRLVSESSCKSGLSGQRPPPRNEGSNVTCQLCKVPFAASFDHCSSSTASELLILAERRVLIPTRLELR